MKLIYTRSVMKDVRRIKDRTLIKKIGKVIGNLKKADHLHTISNLKRLKGHPFAYRIRIGRYRLGFYFSDNTTILSRLLNRTNIYKVFPD